MSFEESEGEIGRFNAEVCRVFAEFFGHKYKPVVERAVDQATKNCFRNAGDIERLLKGNDSNKGTKIQTLFEEILYNLKQSLACPLNKIEYTRAMIHRSFQPREFTSLDELFFQ
jgi:hypothetical protein